MSESHSVWWSIRHPIASLREICGGEAIYPILVLFGLNAVDELDRAAFGILLPEIRDHFNLDLSTMLAIVALSSVAALALQVPIAQNGRPFKENSSCRHWCFGVGSFLRDDRYRCGRHHVDDCAQWFIAW